MTPTLNSRLGWHCSLSVFSIVFSLVVLYRVLSDTTMDQLLVLDLGQARYFVLGILGWRQILFYSFGAFQQ